MYYPVQVGSEAIRGGGVVMYVHNDINCSQVLRKSLSINGVIECVTVEHKT